MQKKKKKKDSNRQLQKCLHSAACRGYNPPTWITAFPSTFWVCLRFFLLSVWRSCLMRIFVTDRRQSRHCVCRWIGPPLMSILQCDMPDALLTTASHWHDPPTRPPPPPGAAVIRHYCYPQLWLFLEPDLSLIHHMVSSIKSCHQRYTIPEKRIYRSDFYLFSVYCMYFTFNLVPFG